MDLFSLLAKNVGVAAWKLLLKRWLGDDGGALAGGVVQTLESKFDDAYNQKKAVRQFEEIGDKIAKRMVPLFQEAQRRGELNLESISYQIGLTLEGNISAEFFVARDLDPGKLTAALREARPLPQATFSEAETSFYGRALDEAVRYVVGLASRLPRFDEQVAAQTLQRLSRMEDDLEQILEAVHHVERTVGSTEDRSIHIAGDAPGSIIAPGDNNIIITHDVISQRQAERYEADYRQNVQRNLNKVELFGADIPDEAQTNLLTEAFVSLNVSAAGNDEKDSGGLLSCEAAFNSLRPGAGRLLIRGAAGSGKTTLMRWAAIHAASTSRLKLFREVDSDVRRVRRILDGGFVEIEELEVGPDEFRKSEIEYYNRRSHIDVNDVWLTRIPFLILLRHCQDGELPQPDGFPKLVAKELGDPPANWVRSVLDKGRALVLIDGVDEVPDDKRKGIYDELKRIVETYKDNYFVVTTRPTAVKKDWLKPLGFREAEVAPLSADDIHRFVDKWHDAVAREMGRQGKPAGELAPMAEQLNEKIDDDPPLFRLATNPLLCAMICALHRKTRQELPQGQRAIVEALCKMLLEDRERLQPDFNTGKFPEAYRELSYPQKRAIVQKLAEHMMLEGESAVDAGRAQKQVELALKSVPGRSPTDAPVVLQSLVERSGMLREPSPGKVDFLHNTFKEMLAGDYLAQDDKVKNLAERALADESWRRAALFAVAGDKPERQPFNDLLVRTVLELDDQGPGKLTKQRKHERRSRHLFLVQCKSVVQFLDAELETQIDALVNKLFPPHTMAEADAIAGLGNLAVQHLKWNKRTGEKRTAAATRALRLINTNTAREALDAYRQDDRMAVISELSEAIEPLSIPAVVPAVQTPHYEDEWSGVIANIKDLGPLREVNDVQQPYLQDTQVSDVSPLAGLSSLQSLYLEGTQVSDVSPLAGLSSLQSLYLGGTQVSEVSPLAGLSSLQTLDLRGTQVSDVSPLAGLSSLQYLVLLGTQVSDVSPLAGLSSLQGLSLGGTQVSEVSPLAGLSSLRSLDLQGTPVSDVSPLAGLSSLQTLGLQGTQVSDVSPLAGLSSLQNLVLLGTQVSDVSPLAGLKEVTIWLDADQQVTVPKELEGRVNRV